MNHSISYWADVVAEIANRREPKWRDRLGRHVEYPLSGLRAIAQDIHNSQIVLDEEGVLQTAEKGFLKLELPWQMEWAARKMKVVARA